MKSEPPFPRAALASCPRCGSSTRTPFGSTGGICLLCAGERAFALVADVPLDALANADAEAPGLLLDTDSGLPASIGPYEIIEELGRGGMGRVFAARQRGLGRIVALKVLNTAVGSEVELEIRFLREAQTVARLRHPNIVTIYDSGRAGGQVYFSMDYVTGGDLARRLREGPLTPTESATLVAKVADALAHAHAEGVLHRDIKPSNILLEGAEPRLADFGLAAQLEQSSDFTKSSTVFGTPHYLAPEALIGGSAALTTASDLYALGVVLYALLTGRTPFAGTPPVALAALVNENDPPAPRLLAPGVPRDLETICLKCLERTPARRYAGATALADDLRRFLAGEPIAAKPPGRVERFQRLALRHRAAILGGSGVAVLLLVGAIGGTSLAVRARKAEKQAAAEAAIAKAISDFFQHDLLTQASPEQEPDRDIKLRTVLDRAAKKIDERFADQPLVEAALRSTIATTYEALEEYAAEVPQLERALALQRQQAGSRAPVTLRLAGALAMAHYHLGEYPRAEKEIAEVLKLQREVLGPEHPDTLESASTLALIQQISGKLAEAEALYRSTLEARRRVLGPDHPDTLETANGLGVVLRFRAQYAEAEAVHAATLEARRRVLGPNHPATQRSMAELATVYFSQGRAPEAEKTFTEVAALWRKSRGVESPDTLTTLGNLVVTKQAQGKFAEAQPIIDEVVATSQRVRGPEHPSTLNLMSIRAQNLAYLERFDDAEKAFTEVMPLLERVLGLKHTIPITVMLNRALNFSGAGRVAEAETAAARAVATARDALGAEHSLTLSALAAQATVLRDAGRLDEAAALFQQTLEARRRISGADHPNTLSTAYGLALTLHAQGKLAEALALQRDTLALRQRKLGAANINTLLSEENVGALLNQLGRFSEAAPLLTHVHQQRAQIDAEHWRTFFVQSLLGESLFGLKHVDEAKSALAAAHAGLERHANETPPAYRHALADTVKRLSDANSKSP